MASWGKHLKQPIKAQQCKIVTTFIDLKLHKLPQLLATLKQESPEHSNTTSKKPPANEHTTFSLFGFREREADNTEC